MSLIEGWTNLIYKVATGSWKVRLVIAPIVGASYLGLIVAFVLLSFAFDQWMALPKAFSYPVSLLLGCTLILSGFLLTCLSIAQFLRVRGTPVPFSPPPSLVVAGPYKFSRNPMLTGIFMQLFGIGTTFGSLSLLFLFTPLFIIANVWELKRVEEPELERRLGAAYVQYKKDVSMFVPSIAGKKRVRM